MTRRRSRCAPALLALTALACTSAVPPVDPGAFACEGDAPVDDVFPCPDGEWCAEGACTSRLGCFAESGRAGCDPDGRCEARGESCARCGLRVTDDTAAVTCEPGVHTTTSTRPEDPETCACPDGTACVTLLDGAPTGSFPLYLLPAGGALPAAQLGLAEVEQEHRLCVRGCGSEVDCPAGHTCRPAAAVNAALLSSPASDRSTIGVCWPDRLRARGTQTASVAVAEPDPLACRQHADCGAGFEPCRFRVTRVDDHPRAPIGAAWGERRALVARCSSEGSSLRNADGGCEQGTECKSGLCVEGRCARPCDPSDEDVCPGNRGCLDVPVSRRLEGSGVLVEDRARLCSSS